MLVNFYTCSGKVNAQKWQCLNEMMSNEEGRVIFCGDFNAKGRLLGNITTHKQGEELEDILVKSVSCALMVMTWPVW